MLKYKKKVGENYEKAKDSIIFRTSSSSSKAFNIGRVCWSKSISVGQGKVLWHFIQNDQIPSMIFWGPPGVGKTTLERIIAKTTHAHFIDFSAVNSGIKEIKKVMQEAMETYNVKASKPLFLLMKFIALIKHSKMLFYPMLNKEV